ncbi:MAG: mandelate racemase/muconate lactonizing enzyme family protein [Bryobacterales bacterium]|nr:mandelate racemase/muconate lactonizing enzyme family protein [Bryobacterales bacterium]
MLRRSFLGSLTAAFAAVSSPLKITKVEAFIIRTPNTAASNEDLMQMYPLGAMTGGAGLYNRLDHASPSRSKQFAQAVLVKVTAGDLYGWGECHAPAAPRVHQTIVTDMLAPVLLGHDARDVEALWDRMYSTQRLRGYSTGFYTEAIAGVDLALWDILGKYTGQPLYRLLGGKYRDRIPTYLGIGGATPEQVGAQAKKAMDQGFAAVKMGLGKGAGTRDMNRVAAAAEAVKGKGQLLLDSLGAFKLHEAIQLGRELDRMGTIGWWEDALMPEDTISYPKLADAMDTAIVAGETLSNRFQFRDLFLNKSVDIVNPDICRAGGVTECRKIAILADAHSVLWSPHVSMGTAPYMSASIHMAVATPNCVIMEGGNKHESAMGNVLLREPLEYFPGYAKPSERPGLGVEFNDAELKRITVAA